MKHAETSSPHILDKWLSHYTLILNIHVQFPQSTLLVTTTDCKLRWHYLCTCASVYQYLCKCDTRQQQHLITDYKLAPLTSKYFDSLPLASKNLSKGLWRWNSEQQPFRTSIQCRISNSL